MASHFSDIGFHFEETEDLYRFLDIAVQSAEVFELPGGSAALYQQDTGLQYWFPLDEEGEPEDYNFHFASGLVNDIRVLECLQADVEGQSGMYRCEIDIDDGAGLPISDVPINVYLPAAGLLGDWESGQAFKAQFACFAENIEIFPSRTAFDAAKDDGERHLAHEHFIPMGTFSRSQEADFEQSERVMFGGTVLTSGRLVNTYSNREYDHLQVTSLDMKYDVLVDPVLYDALPQPGDIIQGVFWVSALVWKEDKNDEKSWYSKEDRLTR